MSVNAIDFSNVWYGYAPGQDVLKGVSLSVEQSTITAVIGRSGSGKSTLLQIINGMIRPREGAVRLHANPIDYGDLDALRLQIGYVVQHIGLFPHMTIFENISILGRITGKPRQDVENRVKALTDMVQLPASYLNKYPHELSGGEQQRAGLCRALLLKPPVLLMDEPFASLDSNTKRSIYRHLLEIQKKENRTIVLVTHDWEETAVLADNFIWIANGQVRAIGGKADLAQLKGEYFSMEE